MISHFSQEPFEATLHIEDADLQKMAKVLNDVNIKECPYFDLSDKYGNSARYYRENQWIPVYERLPEEEGYYLVWLEHGFFEVVHYWNGYWNAFSHCTKNSLEGVIAWMPTPGPYKEEKNGR